MEKRNDIGTKILTSVCILLVASLLTMITTSAKEDVTKVAKKQEIMDIVDINHEARLTAIEITQQHTFDSLKELKKETKDGFTELKALLK